MNFHGKHVILIFYINFKMKIYDSTTKKTIIINLKNFIRK